MNAIRRRELIAGAGGFLAGCSKPPDRREPSAVSIVRARAYTDDLFDTVRRILAEHKLQVRGKRVVLKPNLVEFDRATTINTHPKLVYAALEAFRALGAADVRIAEGPGHRRNTLELAEAAGYFETIPAFEDLFTDLNLDDPTEVPIPGSSKLGKLYLPKTAIGCDLLVSMPKMKTHHWVGATLSMKNFFGLVPGAVYGWPKNLLHIAGIPECIVAINAVLPRVFALVDGIVGMEGNGPIQGTPKAAGVLVAGRDRVAVDATCCRIMAIEPENIAYLKNAGYGCLREPDIRQIGEPVRSVQTPFELLPQFKYLRLRHT